MKPFVNELFSIQIDPAKGSEGNCQLYSLYNDGTFTVIQSAPFSMAVLPSGDGTTTEPMVSQQRVSSAPMPENRAT